MEFVKSNFIILFVAAFCLGLDKGGLKTLLVLCMYFLTKILDVKFMLSVLAPIMFISDLIPIWIYKDHIKKKPIYSFLPFMIIGIIIGSLIGKYLNDTVFSIVLSSFILFMAIMMSYSYYKRKTSNVPFTTPLKIILGFIAGISSISNSAAAITNLYYFKETKTKEEFIGSCSSMFFIVNGLKLLMFIFVWQTITIESLIISLSLIPGMFIGVFCATKLIKVMPQRIFELIIIISVFYVGFMLLIKNVL